MHGGPVPSRSEPIIGRRGGKKKEPEGKVSKRMRIRNSEDKGIEKKLRFEEKISANEAIHRIKFQPFRGGGK